MYTIVNKERDIFVFPTFEKINEYWKANLYDKYMFFKQDMFINSIQTEIAVLCTFYIYIPYNVNLQVTTNMFGMEMFYIDNCITCFEINGRYYTVGTPERVPIQLAPLQMKPITQDEFVNTAKKTKQYINNMCAPIYNKIIDDLTVHPDIKSYKQIILDNLDQIFDK